MPPALGGTRRDAAWQTVLPSIFCLFVDRDTSLTFLFQLATESAQWRLFPFPPAGGKRSPVRRRVWLKTVTQPQCFLKHPDKPLLLEGVLPLVTSSRRGFPAGLRPWQRPAEMGPNPTAADGDGGTSAAPPRHRHAASTPSPSHPPPAAHRCSPHCQKTPPTTFVPLALVALGAGGGDSQDPADGVGRAGGVGADGGHLCHRPRGGCKARPGGQRAGQHGRQPT